jgi:hypothetical protein
MIGQEFCLKSTDATGLLGVSATREILTNVAVRGTRDVLVVGALVACICGLTNDFAAIRLPHKAK